MPVFLLLILILHSFLATSISHFECTAFNIDDFLEMCVMLFFSLLTYLIQ